MRYKSFRIRNFKGIKDTTVNLDTIGGASVFAFVGLNESGKTTILEAIHSFSPEAATSELLGGSKMMGVPIKDRVPRHQLSDFTGAVSVQATVSVSDEEKLEIAKTLLDENDIAINADEIPSELTFEKRDIFENGDFQNTDRELLANFSVKTGRQRSWRSPTSEEKTAIWAAMYNLTPDIAYFPTFVFSFPERIFLGGRGNSLNRFYRSVFQDILDFDGRGYEIEKDIVRRIRGEGLLLPWAQFLPKWMGHDDKSKIDHIMARAGAVVTRVVFGQWNKIFGEDTKNKEIEISYNTLAGEAKDTNGNVIPSDEHEVFIQFQIKDGTRRFKVNDRSLGFRWFFAFMLFTQFRIARTDSRPLLFLFDEPASNLHAAAQQRLIDCFPEIAKGEHALIYTTHSHYMIEPKWLEQTFIVSNRADKPTSSILDEVSLDDESLDVQIASYRSFVNAHPNQISYFQPILDRLEVVPSRFDLKQPSVVLEGKSDYYILRYAAKALKIDDFPLIPGLGAGTFGALAALHVGWNLSFLFVLDADHQGQEERQRYINNFGISEQDVITLNDFLPKIGAIEGLLDKSDLDKIADAIQAKGTPSKGQICRYFQERLASNNIEPLSKNFMERSQKILEGMKAKLQPQKPAIAA